MQRETQPFYSQWTQWTNTEIMVLYVLTEHISSFLCLRPVHGFAFSPYRTSARNTIRARRKRWLEPFQRSHALAVVKINKIIKHTAAQHTHPANTKNRQNRLHTCILRQLRGSCIHVCVEAAKWCRHSRFYFLIKATCCARRELCVCRLHLHPPPPRSFKFNLQNLANDVFCNSMILRAQILIRLR